MPDYGADEALDTPEPAQAAETTVEDDVSEDWPVLVKVALFGIVVAVVGISWRASRSQATYQKIAA